MHFLSYCQLFYFILRSRNVPPLSQKYLKTDAFTCPTAEEKTEFGGSPTTAAADT